MKVKEYREMMKYLTRPGTPDQGQKDMETQVKKSVENNKNPGTFKKLVKEDEAAYRKKAYKKEFGSLLADELLLSKIQF